MPSASRPCGTWSFSSIRVPDPCRSPAQFTNTRRPTASTGLALAAGRLTVRPRGTNATTTPLGDAPEEGDMPRQRDQAALSADPSRLSNDRREDLRAESAGARSQL